MSVDPGTGETPRAGSVDGSPAPVGRPAPADPVVVAGGTPAGDRSAVAVDASALDTVSPVEVWRRSYRRARLRRSIGISLLSTVAFAVVVWLVLANSPGWAVTQETFFSPTYFVQAIPAVAKGMVLNLQVLAVAVVGVAALAVGLATVRSLRGPVFFPLRFLAAAYTDLFRGMPFIVVLYIIGFGVPSLVTDRRIPYWILGTVALVLTYASYVAEVLRAGLDAVHPSQRHAARSLGLTYTESLRFVIIPQAVRKVTPALMNDFISMQKDVGLISVLGAMDAIRQAQTQVAVTYNFTAYVVAGLAFVVLSWPFIRLSDWYTARLRDREQSGGTV